MIRIKKQLCGTAGIFCLLLLAGCDSASTPLDADTRDRIDSLSAMGIRQAHQEMDSLCQLQRKTVLPHLVDSIKQKRLREIEQQLKTVPR